jgi:hypothetical protein
MPVVGFALDHNLNGTNLFVCLVLAISRRLLWKPGFCRRVAILCRWIGCVPFAWTIPRASLGIMPLPGTFEPCVRLGLSVSIDAL